MALQLGSDGKLRVTGGAVVEDNGDGSCCCTDATPYLQVQDCETDDFVDLYVLFDPYVDPYVFAYNGNCYYTSDEVPPTTTPGTIAESIVIATDCEDTTHCCFDIAEVCSGDPPATLIVTFSGVTLCPDSGGSSAGGDPNVAFEASYIGISGGGFHNWCSESTTLITITNLGITYNEAYVRVEIGAFNGPNTQVAVTMQIVRVTTDPFNCEIGEPVHPGSSVATAFSGSETECVKKSGFSITNTFQATATNCMAELGGGTGQYIGYGGTASIEWEC